MAFATFNESTYPAVVEYEGDRLYYVPYKYATMIGPERWWCSLDPVTKFFSVKKHWPHTISIAIIYVLGIHVLQTWMEKRKAFELKRPLIVWNGVLALFSLAGLIRMTEEFVHVLRTYPLLDSISYGGDLQQPFSFWGLCFGLSKFVELGDTVFVVLRKKPLIFLHWYHHAVVLVYVWHALREGVAGGRWFVYMNYAVHTLMYTYYALAAAGIRFPRAVAMVLTTLQTAQMFTGVAISFIVFYHKLQGRLMQQSFEDLFLCFAIYVSFAILFSDFFKKTYLTEKEQNAKKAA